MLARENRKQMILSTPGNLGLGRHQLTTSEDISYTEVQLLNFVGSTGDKGSQPRLWNIKLRRCSSVEAMN